MEKQVQFFGKTASGIHCQSLFGSTGAFEKVAGAPAFAEWETGDELRRFISRITAEQRKKNAYVLVNALGAGEYFGSNINADYFPWNALSHEGDDYGYKTFLNAHAFQHHVNKDPNRAFGKPVLSLLNTAMKRVELVIELDREKAKIEGADGVIVRIDKGEFPDVSMGCKVPYDVCSICHNRSKTRADYCVHMMPSPDMRHLYGPNKILPDGRKVYVVNTHPRFFDISFVFIGADKTAKVMAKLASKGNSVCLGDVCTVSSGGGYTDPVKVAHEEPELQKVASAEPCCDPCGEEKLASVFSVKTSSKRKLGELIKQVPAGTFASQKLPLIEASEPTISRDLLDEMAGHDVGTCCSTSGMLGIVLKPREFQRIILVRMGEGGLADELDSQQKVFKQVRGFDDSVPYDREFIDDRLVALLSSLLRERTSFSSPFVLRSMKAERVKKALPTESRIAHPLLDKISAAYNGYRRNVMLKLSQAVEAVQSDPKLREAVLGNNLVNMFSKTSSALPVVSLDSLSYLMGAHLEDRGLLANTAVADAIAVTNSGLLGVEDLYPAQGS
jgi:hypothetical protein